MISVDSAGFGDDFVPKLVKKVKTVAPIGIARQRFLSPTKLHLPEDRRYRVKNNLEF